MAVRHQPQIAIGENVVEDDELEQLLEAREVAKAGRAAAARTFKDADDAAKGRLATLELELGEAPARCGRFVLSQREVDGHAVSFETSPSTRLTIRVDADDVDEF